MTPEEIKFLRLALGDTQTQFARRLRVSLRAVAYWEKGTTRPLPAIEDKLRRLAARQREKE